MVSVCFTFIFTCSSFIFFFQAEDGIRDTSVTGVQTCALPISARRRRTRTGQIYKLARSGPPPASRPFPPLLSQTGAFQIGRASCRERVEISGGSLGRRRKKKTRGHRDINARSRDEERQ